MTLAIIIPFKSKQVSKDWDISCRSLMGTINSLTQQSNNNFKAVIVGHELPTNINPDMYENIDFLQVDFLPPQKNSPTFTHKDYIFDKNQKITTGAIHLNKKHSDITYWYQLDADDIIAPKFVDYILNQPKASGFLLEGGYLFYQSVNRKISANNLTVFCGSTSIISNEFMTIPDEVDEETVLSIPWCRYPHMNFENYFIKELSKPATIIQEKLLAYVLGHGDNISDGWRNSPIKKLKAFLKPYIKGVPVKKLFED